MQKPALRTIRKPVLHVQIRHEHHAHQVRVGEWSPLGAFAVQIAREVECPQRLRARPLADCFDAGLEVPLLPRALWPALFLNLH